MNRPVLTTASRLFLTLVSLAGLHIAAKRCSAQPELPFTNESFARGIDYLPEDIRSFGCGFACADLNNDGAPDLVLLGKQTVSSQSPYTIGVFQNNGTGHFTNRSRMNGIPTGRAAAGVSAADFDNDGDLDLIISCWLQANLLLRNDGDFRFTNVTTHYAMGVEAAGQSSAWGDVNGDGWLDLYLANRTTSNYPIPPFNQNLVKNLLYINNQGTSFTEVGVAQGVDAEQDPSFQASFFDFDRDGDPDLYLSNDKGASRACQIRNRMWRNDNGQFVNISQSSGTNGCIDAMCLTIADFDHNRYPDMYISNIGGAAMNYLYMNNGNGTFTDRAFQSGTSDGQLAWGSVFFDYNNDGFDDLYVCHSQTSNALYRNLDGALTEDVAQAMAVADSASSYTCAVADIDNDGDMDLMVSNRPLDGVPASFRLYINHEGERRNWMKFRVVGRGANRFAVGAQIDVRTDTTWQWREVIAGSNFKNQNDLVQHVGLNAATHADEIVVRWPKMNGQVVQRTLRNYPANRTWTILPPEALGDANLDGSLDSTDFFACLTCLIDSNGVIGAGCETFDMDGSGQFDSVDFFEFLNRFFDR